MYYKLWLKRFFFSKHHFIRLSPLISITSLMLAGASLTLAMSVYSGYEETVKKSVVDMTGHLVIKARNGNTKEKTILNKIKEDKKHFKSWLPFSSLKALMVYEGRLSGVLLEGVDIKKFYKTLKIHERLTEGTPHLQTSQSALIGKDIAEKLKLKPGDAFHIVAPSMSDDKNFQKTQQTLYVTGLVDFGFYDFNSRYIITSLKTLNNLRQQTKNNISGIHILVKNEQHTTDLRQRLAKKLGKNYQVNDWQGVIKSFHASYFHAVQREKFLIFFILLILIVAGAFNVSSHLSISVLNQIREISILKVMGGQKIFLFNLFLTQGMLISFIGTALGILAGWLLSKGLILIQQITPLIPQDVYKVNTIITQLRFSDIALIFICSQVICLLSCVLPCWRALKLSLREGLLCE